MLRSLQKQFFIGNILPPVFKILGSPQLFLHNFHNNFFLLIIITISSLPFLPPSTTPIKSNFSLIFIFIFYHASSFPKYSFSVPGHFILKCESSDDGWLLQIALLSVQRYQLPPNWETCWRFINNWKSRFWNDTDNLFQRYWHNYLRIHIPLRNSEKSFNNKLDLGYLQIIKMFWPGSHLEVEIPFYKKYICQFVIE